MNHPNSVGIYQLSRLAKKHVTVLLSGEGTDEIFGGYVRHNLPLSDKLIIKLATTTILQKLFPKWIQRFKEKIYRSFILCSSFCTPSKIKSIYSLFSEERAISERLKIIEKIKGDTYFDILLKYEQKTYMVDLLLRQDKMSMAGSIENRVPYLDNQVLDLSNQIPVTEKISTGLSVYKTSYNTKKIVKKLATKYFDKDFVYRKKSGFPLPIDKVFSMPQFKKLYNKHSDTIDSCPYFSKRKVDLLFGKVQNGDFQSVNLFWIIFSFIIWYEKFIVKRKSYLKYLQ